MDTYSAHEVRDYGMQQIKIPYAAKKVLFMTGTRGELVVSTNTPEWIVYGANFLVKLGFLWLTPPKNSWSDTYVMTTAGINYLAKINRRYRSMCSRADPGQNMSLVERNHVIAGTDGHTLGDLCQRAEAVSAQAR